MRWGKEDLAKFDGEETALEEAGLVGFDLSLGANTAKSALGENHCPECSTSSAHHNPTRSGNREDRIICARRTAYL